jgi:hypothetical protein
MALLAEQSQARLIDLYQAWGKLDEARVYATEN